MKVLKPNFRYMQIINKVRLVKPFMMVIAKDIAHAEAIEAKIKNDDFDGGRYKDKVIVVNSKQNGELKDEVLQRLLAIENTDEATEIVIHVNMLGEGWDVNNLYTIETCPFYFDMHLSFL